LEINFKDQKRPVIVVTAETQWDETPRMRHHVSTQLSNYYNILFVELNTKGLESFRIISDSLIVWKLGGYIKGLNRFHLTKLFFSKIQADRIVKKIEKLNYDKKIIINFKYDFQLIYRTTHWCLKYYFMNDDFINMPSDAKKWKREVNRKNQNATIANCHRVFVSADALADDVNDKNKPISVIYSGHDFTSNLNFNDIQRMRPVVCFMGFIHENLEVNWIEELARFNKFDIRLIGPVEDNRIVLQLEKYDSLSFHEPLRGNDLQRFLAECDVFIMPYKNVEVNTKATVPAKLFQYLACGKPIISSPMPNLLNLPHGFVYQSKSKEEFVEKLIEAISNDSEKLFRQRLEYANNHTWPKRGEQLNRIISSDLQARKDDCQSDNQYFNIKCSS
jgi:glycosyltransferase involved in cell wall biosynthesis